MGGVALLLAGVAVACAGLVGVVTVRRGGWTPELHRMALVTLLVPWVAEHAALVRLSRSAALNPLRSSLTQSSLLPGDVAAPLILGAALAVCLLRPRALRSVSILLPVLGSALIWWVTLPLYASTAMRGWFFLTVGLAGPWPFVYHLAATAFLAGYVLPSLGRTRPPASEPAG
jgi:hypothetical protein